MLQREDARRRSLVRETLKELADARAVKGRPTGDGLRDFAELLFSGGAPEDLTNYSPAELGELAEAAWAFSADRTPGEHKLRVVNPEPVKNGAQGALAAVSVIEVVNDNMPFLLDSAMAELQDRMLDVHLVLHPILAVERNARGRRTAFLGQELPASGTGIRESFIHIHVARIESEEERQDLARALGSVFREVRRVVADWKPMLQRLNEEIAGYRTSPPPIAREEIAETVEFLQWIAEDNFTFLGMRQYAFVGDQDTGRLERAVDESGAGLGILRDPEVKVLRRGREFVSYTPEIREFLAQPVPLIVTKANVKARVHRRAHLDYVGVKTFDDEGRLTGELRIVGLFTSTAYNRSVRFIPYLRRKLDVVMARSGFDPDSHSGKALVNVIETFPRDELFQIDTDLLHDWAQTILQLGERPRIRVLARPDKFDRFVSVLVYLPRDRFNTTIRVGVGEMLARAFEGRVSAFYPSFPEGTLVRVHYIIGRYEGQTPRPDAAALEAEVARLSRTWSDDLKDELASEFDAPSASELFHRYAGAFSVAYQEAYPTPAAVADIPIIEQLSGDRPLAISFHRPQAERPERLALKLFRLAEPVPLSERVPILERMGFNVINERSFRIDRPRDEEAALVWLHDMVLERADGDPVAESLDEPLKACFMAVVRGLAESDGYNALVVKAGLGWRDIAMLRSYSRYLRQVRIPYSQGYMWQTLVRHGAIARLLVDLFHTRFGPGPLAVEEREEKEGAIVAQIEAALEEVASLDEDTILRRFANLLRATVRTNFFQTGADGQPKQALAFKLDSQAVDALPQPRPFAEIFVYSPRVEGVHLRGGKIARGGLRWSDRPQDFRTEILGLMKAQQVKNAVIVPVGAKGGFVPKLIPAGAAREVVQAEGTACYKTFISSLLDVTDNIVEGQLVPPDQTVRRDGDDPYLVVAADKGTATFSDTANAISLARGFWLGDAFASGGSAGYDHKEMGITARGAWEAVKRHFREMDVDIQTQPFTVIGCGDMSGDVFGNGMLLSEQIRLLAAFDHRDVFIDPDPDPATSFAERRRLFETPRSSWQDYSRELISKGGGVFSRSAKSIPLSPQMQKLLDLPRKSATPSEVIHALLQAEADLLWFGGIGTYVRGSEEDDDEVGDRANDAVRISAAQLGVKVIGEGANLGMTQRARIEFAQRGGRLNTDAIDNSAGVNSSDMEVNIKIALRPVVTGGAISPEDRNDLLAEMTEEVASLVLRNNYLQTLAISLAEHRGREDLGFEHRLMLDLESRGELDRAVETLPDDAAMTLREEHGHPLTRPELAVLLAYAKIDLYGRLLDSTVPDDPYLGRELMRYFPVRLRERFPGAIEHHQLRREIISTMLANSMINRGGPTLVVRMADETGAGLSEIAAAFAAARNAFSLTELNEEIDRLDNQIPGALQLELYGQVQDLLLGATAWFLRNADLSAGLAGVIDHYRNAIGRIGEEISGAVPAGAARQIGARAGALRESGVPDGLADRLAALPWLSRAPDIVLIAERTGKPLPSVAKTFFCLGEHFHIPRIVAAAGELGIVDYYDRLALKRSIDLLSEAERRLTAELLATGKIGEAALAAWSGARGAGLARTERAIADIERGPMSLARVAVAATLLLDLVGD